MATHDEKKEDQSEDILKQIDKSLEVYYKLCGITDYRNKNEADGKFLLHCKKEGLNASNIDQQLSSIEKCAYLNGDLLKTFPVDGSIKGKDNIKEELFDVIKYCYKYGQSPLPRSRYPQQIKYNINQCEQHIKSILHIICPDNVHHQTSKNQPIKQGPKSQRNKPKIDNDDEKIMDTVDKTTQSGSLTHLAWLFPHKLNV